MKDDPCRFVQARPGLGRFLSADCAIPGCRERCVILQKKNEASLISKCAHATGLTVEGDTIFVRFQKES
jgi:hypothetical protein